MQLDEAKAKYPGSVTLTFGDSEGLCTEFLALVRTGKKTATCGALRLDADTMATVSPGFGR